MVIEEVTMIEAPNNQEVSHSWVEGFAEFAFQISLEHGMELGRAQEAAHLTVRVLTNRFGSAPAELDAVVKLETDPDRQYALFDLALSCPTLAAFEDEVRRI